MSIVVDSSVLVAALVDTGAGGAWAEDILGQDDLLAPALVHVEAVNVLRRLERTREITTHEANAALEDLMELDVELHAFEPLAERVWELRHNVSGYDGWYVALAEALELAAERSFALLDTLRGRPADQVARGFLAGWRAALKRASLEINCVMMAVTVAAQSPALRAKAGEIFRAWRARLAEVLQEGGIAPDRAPALAAGLIAACEGAVAMARAEGSLAPFELMAKEQINAIRAALTSEHERAD